MSIRYGYVDPKDMSAFQVIEPGEGKFIITKAEEKKSKSNNEMMEVTMTLTNHKGQSTMYREYIVSSNDPAQNKSTATKIYNILNAIGRGELYGTPLEPRHLERGRGKCYIKTQKSDDPRYQDKSVVAQYTSAAEAMENELAAAQESEFDDSIPF
jgi:hypothetical protein